MDIAQAYVQILPSTEGIKGQLEQALGGEASAAGESAGKKAGGKFTAALGVAAKATGAGIAAAATATGALLKSSVSEFGEYEQLAGGIETLFKDSSDAVMKNAEIAFKTAGLDANAYMDTAIQSAAAMIESLGGDRARAAELTNQAIVDMSDNVNKMGTSMESLQYAYRGFSRGNFTMLDNLALGFAGTKEGMQDLLDKAQELSGVEYDIGSYADIVEAIHVVQTEMGITGTTALEAESTIQGSLNAVKSAWANLVTGLSNPEADLGVLISNLTETATTALSNLVPVIGEALGGVGQLIAGLGPVIIAELPGLIETVLPGLLEAAISMLNTVAEVLPGVAVSLISILAGALIDNLPTILTAAGKLIFGLAIGLVEAIPELVQKIPLIVKAIAQTLIDNKGQIMQAFISLFGAIVSALPSIIGSISMAVAQIVYYIISGLMGAVGQMVSMGAQLIAGLVRGILSAAVSVVQAAANVASQIAGKVKSFFGIASPSKLMAEYGGYLDEGLAEGIDRNADTPARRAVSMSQDVAEAAVGGLSTRPMQTASMQGAEQSDKVAALLEHYLPLLANLKVVMDGAEVGVLTAPGVDQTLGEGAYYTTREAFA